MAQRPMQSHITILLLPSMSLNGRASERFKDGLDRAERDVPVTHESDCFDDWISVHPGLVGDENVIGGAKIGDEIADAHFRHSIERRCLDDPSAIFIEPVDALADMPAWLFWAEILGLECAEADSRDHLPD